MNKGSIYLDVLICINITIVIVFMLFNSINLDERTKRSIKNIVTNYEFDISSSFINNKKCELEKCIVEDIEME